MNEENQPKISGMEATMLIIVTAFFDLLDLLATLADVAVGMGEVLKILINIVISPMLWFWAKMKGVRSEQILYGSALEFIPLFGNTLPIRTITMIMVIYADWHPKERLAIDTAAKVIKVTRK